MIFLYADGASRGNPGPAAYGVHICDDSGNTLADLGEALGIATNNQAEYSAVIAGLRYLSQTSYRSVTIRMDSKLVVEQLAGNWKINNPQLRELADQAKELLRDFEHQLEWIPRDQNFKADANANLALDEGNFSSTAAAELELASVQPRSIRAPRQYVEPTTIIVVRHGHTENTENVIWCPGETEPTQCSRRWVRGRPPALLRKFQSSWKYFLFRHLPWFFTLRWSGPLKPLRLLLAL